MKYSPLLHSAFYPVFLLFLLTPPLLHSQTTVKTTQELYQEGLGLYQSKEWDEAAARWKLALGAEPNNPIVLYNLGLAKYRQKKLGESIGLWRKALFFDPGLSSARKALVVAVEKTDATLAESTWLIKASSFLSLPAWLTLTFLCFTGFGWLLISFLSKRKTALQEELPTPSFPYALLIFSVFFVLFLASSTIKYFDQSQTLGTIVSSGALAKSSPNKEATDLFKIPEGSEVILKQVSKNWVQALLPGGLSGWVLKKEIFQNSGEALW